MKIKQELVLEQFLEFVEIDKLFRTSKIPINLKNALGDTDTVYISGASFRFMIYYLSMNDYGWKLDIELDNYNSLGMGKGWVTFYADQIILHFDFSDDEYAQLRNNLKEYYTKARRKALNGDSL